MRSESGIKPVISRSIQIRLSSLRPRPPTLLALIRFSFAPILAARPAAGPPARPANAVTGLRLRLRAMQKAARLTSLFAAALSASMALKFWLASRQMRHVAQHRDAV